MSQPLSFSFQVCVFCGSDALLVLFVITLWIWLQSFSYLIFSTARVSDIKYTQVPPHFLPHSPWTQEQHRLCPILFWFGFMVEYPQLSFCLPCVLWASDKYLPIACTWTVLYLLTTGLTFFVSHDKVQLPQDNWRAAFPWLDTKLAIRYFTDFPQWPLLVLQKQNRPKSSFPFSFIHFLYLLVPEVMVVGVSWSLYQLSQGEGRHQCHTCCILAKSDIYEKSGGWWYELEKKPMCILFNNNKNKVLHQKF